MTFKKIIKFFSFATMTEKKITLALPKNLMLLGSTGSGKTFFLVQMLKKIITEKKGLILYTTTTGYDIKIETEMNDLKHQHPNNVILIQTKYPNQTFYNGIYKLVEGFEKGTPVVLILDNFTHSLQDDATLDMLTISRKRNISVWFLVHTLTLSPRTSVKIRQSMHAMFIFFNGANERSLKMTLLHDDLVNLYLDNIKFQAFNKIYYDIHANTWTLLDKDDNNIVFTVNEKSAPKQNKSDSKFSEAGEVNLTKFLVEKMAKNPELKAVHDVVPKPLVLRRTAVSGQRK